MSLPSSTDLTHPKATIARNSLVITVAQLLGVCLGLMFDVLTVLFFGVSAEMDAFFVGLAVPQLLFSAFSSVGIRVLTPMFAEAHEREPQMGLINTFSGVVNYLTLLAFVVVVVGVVTAPLVGAIFGLSAEGEAIATQSSRILLISLLPLAIIEPMRAMWVLQKHFFLSALFYFLRYGGCVLGLLWLRPSLGVFSLAWAYVVGSFLPLLIYLLFFVRQGNRYRLILGRQEAVLSQLTSRLGPPVVGELIGQSNIIVERFFASFLPPGVVSVFGYGRRLFVALNGLVANSIVVAILPRLSQEAITQNIPRLRQTIFLGIQLMSLVVGYIAILIVASSGMLVNFLEQQGVLTPDLSPITTLILISLAPILVIAGATQIFMSPFFAFGETRIILYFRILFLGINFLISFVFFSWWGATGLALSLATSLLIQACLWWWAVARRLHGFEPQMYLFGSKFILASILLSGVLYYLVSALELAAATDLLMTLGIVFLVVTVLVGGMAFWLKIFTPQHLLYAYQKAVAYVRP